MTKLMNKKLTKKGFTLAELLVVIAIIAILVAIAVPIFTGQLNKARISRDQANVRSAKASAITAILVDESGKINLADPDGWYVTFSFNAKGEAQNLALADGEEGEDAEATADEGKIDYKGTTYWVHLESKDIEINTGD